MKELYQNKFKFQVGICIFFIKINFVLTIDAISSKNHSSNYLKHLITIE